MILSYGKQDSYIQNSLPLFEYSEKQRIHKTMKQRYGHIAKRYNVSLSMASAIANASGLEGGRDV